MIDRRTLPAVRGAVLLLVATALVCRAPSARAQDEKPESDDTRDMALAELVDFGLAEAAKGEYAAAIEHLTSAAAREKDPGLPDAQAALGSTLLIVGEYEKAEAALRKALAAKPDLFDAELQFAELLALRGRDADAETIFRKRLGSPESPNFRAHVGLAALQRARGERKEADETLLVLARFAEKNVVEDRDRLFYLGLAYQQLPYERFENHAQMAMDALHDAEKLDGSFLPVTVAEGYLFLEKYQEGEAVKQGFRLALNKNPRFPDALVGLAETYLFMVENDKARKEVEAALQVNPRHVKALCLRAYFAFDDHDYAGAKAVIDKALEVNPRNREALAYEAAHQIVTHDASGYEATMKSILAIDPSYGEAYYIVGEVLALNRRFEEARDLCRKAIATDAKLWKAYTSLAKYCFNTGLEEEARNALKKVQEGDPYDYKWRENMQIVAGKLENFVTASNPRFNLRLHVSESAVMKRYLLELLDRAWTTLSAKYRFTPEGPITVELFPDEKDFAVRTLGFPGIEGVLGACFGKVMTLKSPHAMEAKGTFLWARTAWHEFAHVITLQLSKSRVPRWLTEGLSTYEEGEARADWARDMDLDLINAIANGDLIKMKDLNATFMTYRIGFAYYQSGLICQFIDQKFGFEKILEMLKLYAEDLDTPEVLRRVFGLSEDDFDAAFENFARSRVADFRVRPEISYDTVQSLRRVLARSSGDSTPEAVRALKLVASGYLAAGKSVDAGPYLARLLKAAPQDPETFFLQAELAISRHREQDAVADLDKGFSLGGDEFFAHQLRGSLALRGGNDGEKSKSEPDPEKGLDEFRKAKACFPTYVGKQDPYHLIAKILMDRDERDAAMEELAAFCRIQQTDYDDRIDLADWRIEKKDFAAAAAWLEEANWIDPFDMKLHRKLASCYRSLHENEKAIRELEVALELAEKDDQKLEVHVELAETLLEAGRNEEARDELELALEIDPNYEPAQGLLKKLP